MEQRIIQPKYNFGGYALCSAKLEHKPHVERAPKAIHIKAIRIEGDSNQIRVMYSIGVDGENDDKAEFVFLAEYPLGEAIDFNQWKEQGCPDLCHMLAFVLPYFRQTIAALTQDSDGAIVLPILAFDDDMIRNGVTFLRQPKEETKE